MASRPTPRRHWTPPSSRPATSRSPTSTQALSASSTQVPAGTITNGSLGTNVVTNPAASDLADLPDVVVGTNGGAPVTLGEVATITQAPGAKQTTSELDGKPNVSLTITAQDSANAIATDDAVKAELATLQAELPKGVSSTITSDSTTFTTAALSATVEDLVLAIILASLVILLFLQSGRETLIVLIAIPTSLLTTLLAMYAFGFSLDVISLLAFSLLIGILVDDAIVVWRTSAGTWTPASVRQTPPTTGGPRSAQRPSPSP